MTKEFRNRIRGFFSSPVPDNEEQTRQAWVLRFIIWSLLLVCDTQFFVLFLLLPQNWPRWLAIILTFNFILPPLLILNHRGRTRLAAALLVSFLWTLASVLAFTARGIHALAVLMYIVLVLIAGILFGARGGVIAGIVFCLTALGLVLFGMGGMLPPSRINYTALSIWAMVAICLEFMVIFQLLFNHRIQAALEQAKKNEIALSESRQRYREVFETASDCIFLIDVRTDGQFLHYHFNPATERVVGLNAVEAAGRTPEQIFPPDVAQAVTANYQRCIAQGAPIDYDETIIGARNKRYQFHTTLIPLKDAEERVYRLVGIAHDITARKEAEAVLRQSRDELEARVQERTAELRQVNEELEAFSYSVSHDLRSPLRRVAGFTDILMSGHAQELSSEARELVTMTRDSALQMNEMIEALLSLSRIDRQPLNPRPVNLTALVRETLTDLQAEQQGNMDIRVANLPDCTGDPVLLRQVFVNLLSNAMKYSRNRPVPVIEVGFKAEDNETIYYVRDNGAGFDMQCAKKLFGVFERLHSAEEFSGTGVGLSIVRRILHRHGGGIWAEAAVDKGATFYFTLPRKVAQETISK